MPSIKNIFKLYRNLIFSGMLLLFCAFGFAIGVLPAAQKVHELFAQVQLLSTQATHLQSKLNALNGLDEESLRQQLAVVLSAVPSDKSLPTVFSTVEGLAAQSGVSVVSVGIGGDTTIASQSAKKQTAQETQLGSRIIPFSVTIRGTLDTIERFITLAPQVRRLLRIRTFAITFQTLDQPVNIALEMDAFYEPMPKAVGNAAQALPTITDKEQATISKISEFGLASGNELALPSPQFGEIKINPFSP